MHDEVLVLGLPRVSVVPTGLGEEGVQEPVLQPVPQLLVPCNLGEGCGVADLVAVLGLSGGRQVVAKGELELVRVRDTGLVEHDVKVGGHEEDVHDAGHHGLFAQQTLTQPSNGPPAADLHPEYPLVHQGLLAAAEEGEAAARVELLAGPLAAGGFGVLIIHLLVAGLVATLSQPPGLIFCLPPLPGFVPLCFSPLPLLFPFLLQVVHVIAVCHARVIVRRSQALLGLITSLTTMGGS
mmetsp:Transcript_46075/g.147389  ORF Transcript_46075/g.147389 Transcript_46075/m.147389 type:complete len:238 (+) Transcript_46075:7812-8525(+)